MRILMIAPTPFFSHRGTHIRIFEEARALERHGHNIMIVSYHVGDDIHEYVDTQIDVRRIRRWLFWYKKTEAGADWQKIILNIFLIRKVFTMTRTWRPDIIHGHLHEGVVIGWLVQHLFFWRKMPLVADFHGSLVGEMRSHGYLGIPPLGTIFRTMEHWINGLGTTAIVSSAENIPVIKKARIDKCVEHVYDGVDSAQYDKLNVQQQESRKRFGIPENACTVLYTGALIANKGVQIYLDAARDVIRSNKHIHFVIGGHPADWVQKYVKIHKLEGRVHVISPLNYFTLPEINSLGDIAVDPKDSTVRQASGKILQYMAAKMAIICTDRPTNRRYLDDAGIYLKEMTPESLATHIRALCANQRIIVQKSRYAHKRAQSFHWDKVGEKLERVYTSALNKE